MSGFVVDVLARMVILLYEAEFLKTDMCGNKNNSRDVLSPDDSSNSTFDTKFEVKVNNIIVVCSFIRVFYMVVISNMGLILACERYFATVFINTYEKKKRVWIPTILITLICAVSCFGSYVFHYEKIPRWSTVVLGISMNALSFFAFFGLYTVNVRKLQFFKTRDINDKYSLSYRFQLNENVKVMRWGKTVSLFVCVLDCTLIFFLIGACYETDSTLPTYLHFILNLLLVIYGQSCLFIILLCDKTFRKYFLRNKHIRTFTYPLFSRWFPKDFGKQRREFSTNERTEIHFTNLSSQWEKVEQVVQPEPKPAPPAPKKRKTPSWLSKYKKRFNKIEQNNASNITVDL